MKVCDCGHPPSEHSSFTTGYGSYEGRTYCYDCCAENDKQYMRDNGKITLYLIEDDREITNWPGSLRFKCGAVRRGRHVSGQRLDTWFTFEGYTWHAVQYGFNTQIARCTRTKERT